MDSVQGNQSKAETASEERLRFLLDITPDDLRQPTGSYQLKEVGQDGRTPADRSKLEEDLAKLKDLGTQTVPYSQVLEQQKLDISADKIRLKITDVPDNIKLSFWKDDKGLFLFLQDQTDPGNPKNLPGRYDIPSSLASIEAVNASGQRGLISVAEVSEAIDGAIKQGKEEVAAKKPVIDSEPDMPGDGRTHIVDSGYKFKPSAPTERFDDLPLVVRANQAAERLIGGGADALWTMRGTSNMVRMSNHMDRAAWELFLHRHPRALQAEFADAARGIRREALINLPGFFAAEYAKGKLDSMFFKTHSPGALTYATDIVSPMIMGVPLSPYLPPRFRWVGYVAKPAFVAGAHCIAEMLEK